MSLKPGYRISFRDEETGKFVYATCDRWDGRYWWVVLDDGVLWPLRVDEIYPGF